MISIPKALLQAYPDQTNLAAESFSTDYIPQPARDAITHYEHLALGNGKSVRCPYYRNPRSGTHRWGLNAFSGKGSAQEIEEELKIIQKLEGKELASLPQEEVRDIMKKHRLGVECSGFVAHVLDAWVRETKKQRIFQVLAFPPRSPWGKLAVLLRPFTHIGVATLIDPRNAKEFLSLQEFRPGDLMYFHNEIDHVALVTGVTRDAHTIVQKISYAHSVREDAGEGIKEGTILIGDTNKPILLQEWHEMPETGHTLADKAARGDRQTVVRFFHPLFLAY